MELFIPTPFGAFEVRFAKALMLLPTFKIETLGGGL